LAQSKERNEKKREATAPRLRDEKQEGATKAHLVPEGEKREATKVVGLAPCSGRGGKGRKNCRHHSFHWVEGKGDGGVGSLPPRDCRGGGNGVALINLKIGEGKKPPHAPKEKEGRRGDLLLLSEEGRGVRFKK